MRAIWITKHGGPEVLSVRETPDPPLGRDEVKIRVKAAGLNFAEVTARQGLYPDAPRPPCVVGYEGAGVVEARGEAAGASPPVGARVLYLSRFGGQADTVCVPAHQVLAIPDAMSFEQAAALPVNYLTAHHVLFEVYRLRPGAHVLIHMAAGGVGTAALQLCRTVADVTTYGTASPSKHDYLRQQGCDQPIDYRGNDYVREIQRLTNGRGVDLVVDPLGGPDWRRGYSLLRPCGMLVACGVSNVHGGQRRNLFRVVSVLARSPRFSPISLMNDNRAVGGVNMGHLWGEGPLLRRQMVTLLELYEAGRLAPQVCETVPFSRAADAHRILEERRNLGKVVLIPD